MVYLLGKFPSTGHLRGQLSSGCEWLQVIDDLESTLHQARKEVHRGRAEGIDYVKQLEEKKEAELQVLRNQLQVKKTEVEGLRREKEHSCALM